MNGVEALSGLPVAQVSDALDELGFRSQVLAPEIRALRPGSRLAGRAVPVVVEATGAVEPSPYEGDMRLVESLRPRDVPVFGAGARVRAALWGELLSCAALGRGAKGAVVDGYVRDARQMGELGFPVFCRGCSPLDTRGRAIVRGHGVQTVCGDVAVAPGDYVLADEDGVVVVPAGILDDVVELVRSRDRGEQGAKADLLAGVSIVDVWQKWQIL